MLRESQDARQIRTAVCSVHTGSFLKHNLASTQAHDYTCTCRGYVSQGIHRRKVSHKSRDAFHSHSLTGGWRSTTKVCVSVLPPVTVSFFVSLMGPSPRRWQGTPFRVSVRRFPEGRRHTLHGNSNTFWAGYGEKPAKHWHYPFYVSWHKCFLCHDGLSPLQLRGRINSSYFQGTLSTVVSAA